MGKKEPQKRNCAVIANLTEKEREEFDRAIQKHNEATLDASDRSKMVRRLILEWVQKTK